MDMVDLVAPCSNSHHLSISRSVLGVKLVMGMQPVDQVDPILPCLLGMLI